MRLPLKRDRRKGEDDYGRPTSASRKFMATERLRELFSQPLPESGPGVAACSYGQLLSVRVAMGANVPIQDVCEITGLTESEVRSVMEGRPESATPPEPASQAPGAGLERNDVPDGANVEDGDESRLSPAEQADIQRRAGEARARGDLDEANRLDAELEDAADNGD